MLPRFLSLGVGAVALMVLLAAPNQVHAQRGRGGVPHGGHPGFNNRMMPGFHHGVFGRPFGPGPRTFDPRFRRFDRFEDRFERRFDRGFFVPLYPGNRPNLPESVLGRPARRRNERPLNESGSVLG